jgi:hypothetical protein
MKKQGVPLKEIEELVVKIERVLEKNKEGIVVGAIAFLVSKWMITLEDEEHMDPEDLLERHVELVKWFYDGWEKQG